VSDPIVIKMVYNNFPRVKVAAKVGARKIVSDYSDKIHRNIVVQMLAPKHGRMYWGKSGRKYRASAPGEAPAIDTGSYWRSIRERWVATYTRAIYTNDPRGDSRGLGPTLEYGTAGGKIKARPHFRPAVNRYEYRFTQDMKNYLQRMNK
jgi:hypothetical protein